MSECKNQLHFGWVVIAENDHEITKEEHHDLLDKTAVHFEKLGYQAGGWSGVYAEGELLPSQKREQDLRAENERLKEQRDRLADAVVGGICTDCDDSPHAEGPACLEEMYDIAQQILEGK